METFILKSKSDKVTQQLIPKTLSCLILDAFPPLIKDLWVALFAHGCDVTSTSLVGSPMAITQTLTHLILINLFIKVELSTFSPTSPAKYCFWPKHFLAYVWLVYQGTKER